MVAVAIALTRLCAMYRRQARPGRPDLVWVVPGAADVVLEAAEHFVVKGTSGGVSDITQNFTLPFRALVADPIAEARRLHAGAQDEGITARLLGGVAVALSTTMPLRDVLRRSYKDLDYVVRRSDARRWRDFLEANGYESDVQFNTLHGSQRLLHHDALSNRQVDTFVSTFAMCHSIDLEDHLPSASPTPAPEDILLTKLQIFEVNDKDLIDSIALLLGHPVTSGNEPGINRERLARTVGTDWGWFTTVSDNLAKVATRLPTVGLDEVSERTVTERLAQLHEFLSTAPRSLKWRARARAGRRLPWYDLPEEVN